MVPTGGVEDLALEPVETVNVRQCRLGERANGRDHEIRRELPLRSAHVPPRLVLVPSDLLNFDSEPMPVKHVVLSGNPLDVGLNLGLFGVRTAPTGVRREREGIQVRRHIAGRARVGVHPPRAADVISPLEDQEVGVPVLLKGDRGTEPGESGPDDQHADMDAGSREMPSGAAIVTTVVADLIHSLGPWFIRGVTPSGVSVDPKLRRRCGGRNRLMHTLDSAGCAVAHRFSRGRDGREQGCRRIPRWGKCVPSAISRSPPSS